MQQIKTLKSFPHPTRSFTMFTPDQFATVQQRNVEAFLTLSQKAFENVEKVVALNLQTTKANFDDTREAVLGAKDPKALFSAPTELLQPAIEKATTYSRELYEIAAQANAEFSKATEASVVQARQQMLALIEGAMKNAPAGSENVVNLFKTGLLAANQAFDGVQNLAKKATETVEANVSTFAAKTMKAPAKAKR
jgi:phasin family protein